MGANNEGRSAASGLRCCAIYALASALGLSAAAAHASTIVIDDFSQPHLNNPAQFFSVPPGNNSSLQMSQIAPTANVIGGQRDSLFQVNGSATLLGAFGNLGFDSLANSETLEVVTSGPAPMVSSLQYSGVHSDGSPQGSLVNGHGLNVDLTDGGTNDRFVANFYAVDTDPTAGLCMTVTITSPGGKSSSATVTVPNSPTSFNFSIPFNLLLGNALITHVDSITVAFNGTDAANNRNPAPDVDFELHTFVAVPEPSAVGLAVVGGVLIIASVFGRFRFPSAAS